MDIRLPGMDGGDFIRELNKINPKVVCLICTGSHEYCIPDDIAILPQVADKVYAKPVMNLLELVNDLQRQIDQCSVKGDDYE